MLAEIEKLRAKAPALDWQTLRHALVVALTERHRKACEAFLAALERPDAFQPETRALMAKRVAQDRYLLTDGFGELLEVACKSLGVK